MQRADGGEVGPDTFWSFQSAGDPEPYCEQTQVFTGNRDKLDVCQLAELEEGFPFGVQGFASAGGPSVTLEEPGVEL